MAATLKPHRYAALFRVMDAAEFSGLVSDLRDQGQAEPIIVYEGAILDGVNRYNACRQLGLEPLTRQWNGSDAEALDYAVSHNLVRRHLSPSERATLAPELAPLYAEAAIAREKAGKRADPGMKSDQGEPDAKGRVREHLASVLHVAPATVVQALYVGEHAPEALESVRSGDKSLNAAYKEAKGGSSRKTASATDSKRILTSEKHAAAIIDSLSELNKPTAATKAALAVARNLAGLLRALSGDA